MLARKSRPPGRSTTTPSGAAHIPVDTDKLVGGSRRLGEVRDLIRCKHSSIRTEQAYLAWAKRFVRFHGKRHPKEMGGAEITAFLNPLAVERNVAASTQNQALNALVLLYTQVLGREAIDLQGLTRAKRPERLPTVFDRGEIECLLKHLEHPHKLVAALLDGGGLRLLEALRLRIQDIEFERSQIIVRSGKGAKDRVTLLPPPPPLVNPVREQRERAKALHAEDLAAGLGEVYLPYALAMKYPNAARQWAWHYLFPADSTALDPRSAKVRRHPVGESAMQRAVKGDIHAAGIRNWACASIIGKPSCARRRKRRELSGGRGMNCGRWPMKLS